jgi:hypothetical protein
MNKSQISVDFEVEYQVDPRDKFQREGHFVPALRERDAEGNSTPQPRTWGPEVHALTLLTPGGDVARVKDSATGKEQSLSRALSDSLEDAERILAEQIRDQFWAAQRALAIVGFNANQARKVKDERDRMAAWMLEHHPAEFARVLGIAEAAVAEYQAQEKSPELRAYVEAILDGRV